MAIKRFSHNALSIYIACCNNMSKSAFSAADSAFGSLSCEQQVLKTSGIWDLAECIIEYTP